MKISDILREIQAYRDNPGAELNEEAVNLIGRAAYKHGNISDECKELLKKLGYPRSVQNAEADSSDNVEISLSIEQEIIESIVNTVYNQDYNSPDPFVFQIFYGFMG